MTTKAPYHPRLADEMLRSRLSALGAVVLEGVKGCGKTRTARQLAASEVLLDRDEQARNLAAFDPGLVLDGATPRLVDEWQRVPTVWDAARRAVDDRGLPGQFILTGSATPADDVPRHSGAGRFSVLRMRTMTLFEQHFSSGHISLAKLLNGGTPAGSSSEVTLPEYVERIVVGGWPALLGADAATAKEFNAGYVDLIAEHDVEAVSGARRNPKQVRRFMRAYAQLTAHPAQVTAIMKRAVVTDGEPLNRKAVDPYLDALQRMWVVDDIEAWDPSLRSRTRLVGIPKRLLADPSLSASLMDASPTRLLRDLKTLGFLFEALVLRDLRVYAQAAGANVYHYREQAATLEVDAVVETSDGQWAAFEIKLGSEEGLDAAAKSLLRLKDKVVEPPRALAVITATRYAYLRNDGVWVIPLACLGP